MTLALQEAREMYLALSHMTPLGESWCLLQQSPIRLELQYPVTTETAA